MIHPAVKDMPSPLDWAAFFAAGLMLQGVAKTATGRSVRMGGRIHLKQRRQASPSKTPCSSQNPAVPWIISRGKLSWIFS
jgi:hypothetical protein